MRRLLILAGLLLLAPTGTRAQTEKGNFEWGLFLGREFFSNDSGADDDYVAGLRFGYGIIRDFELEVIYDNVDTNVNPQAEVVIGVKSLTANFIWNFWTTKRKIAGMYVSGGVGTLDASIEIVQPTLNAGILPTTGWVGNIPNPVATTYKDDSTLVTLAAGARAFVGKRVAFRYELRAKDYEVFQIPTTDLEITFGFSVFNRRKN